MAAPAPTLAQSRQALASVREHFAPTPLLDLFGATAKLETRAPTGSFKVRGAIVACERAAAQGVAAVVAASAGNHGKGMAWAARATGTAVTIVVPRDCPAIKREAMERDATVIVCDAPGYDAAEVHARALAAERGVPFVSPFDDTLVMAGNGGTVALELVSALREPLELVVPVGGGGLLSGILAVREALGLDWTIAPAQSEASAAFATSVRERRTHLSWPAAQTLAEGLEGGAGETSVRLAIRAGLEPVVVSEAAIARAMLDLADALGESVEGSAAAALAAHRALAPPTRRRVILLTGGNVARATLDQLRERAARP